MLLPQYCHDTCKIVSWLDHWSQHQKKNNFHKFSAKQLINPWWESARLDFEWYVVPQPLDKHHHHWTMPGQQSTAPQGEGGKQWQFFSSNNTHSFVMLCLCSVLLYMMPLLISFRVASLALGQSYDCPSASEVTLKDMSKIRHYLTQQLNSTNGKNMCVFLGMYCTLLEWFLNCVVVLHILCISTCMLHVEFSIEVLNSSGICVMPPYWYGASVSSVPSRKNFIHEWMMSQRYLYITPTRFYLVVVDTIENLNLTWYFLSLTSKLCCYVYTWDLYCWCACIWHCWAITKQASRGLKR